MLTTERRTKRFSLEEYRQMAEYGILGEARVELLDGEIVEMSPQNYRHSLAIAKLNEMLVRHLSPKYVVFCQAPAVCIGDNLPEPDFSVLPREARTAGELSGPALLVIEVSDSTLHDDRTRKASLYAAAGVQEYWILNLNDRCLEIYRKPLPDSEALFGFRYATMVTLGPGESASPLIQPDANFPVGEMLP